MEELTPIVVRNRQSTAGKDEVQLSRTIAGKILTEKQAISDQLWELPYYSGFAGPSNPPVIEASCRVPGPENSPSQTWV